MNITEKIKLLSLVENKAENTGKFNYSPFVSLLPVEMTQNDKQPLSGQERIKLVILVGQQIDKTGRFDYDPFIQQIGKTAKPSQKLPENQPSITKPETPLVEATSTNAVVSPTVEIAVDATSTNAVVSPTVEIAVDANSTTVVVSPTPETATTAIVKLPLPSNSVPVKGEDLEQKRLQYLQKLCQDLRLLEMVFKQVKITGKFNYPNFTELLSNANQSILAKRDLSVALRDITEGVNGLLILITERQCGDYQQQQKLLELIIQGTYQLENIYLKYCPTPKKPWFKRVIESPTTKQLNKKMSLISRMREMIYEDLLDTNLISNSNLFYQLTKLQLYSTEVVMSLNQLVN